MYRSLHTQRGWDLRGVPPRPTGDFCLGKRLEAGARRNEPRCGCARAANVSATELILELQLREQIIDGNVMIQNC